MNRSPNISSRSQMYGSSPTPLSEGLQVFQATRPQGVWGQEEAFGICYFKPMNGSLTTTNLAQRPGGYIESSHTSNGSSVIGFMARTYEQGSFIEGAESSGLWAVSGFRWAGSGSNGCRRQSEPRPREPEPDCPPTPPVPVLSLHAPPPCTGVSPTSQGGRAAWATWVRCHPGSCYKPAWIQFPSAWIQLPASSSPPLPPGPPELHDRCAHSPPHTPHECTRLNNPNLCSPSAGP